MGAVVDPFTFTNGTVADATEVNSRFNTLYTLVNGNLDSANMDLTAAFIWTGAQTFNGVTTFGAAATFNDFVTFNGLAGIVMSSGIAIGLDINADVLVSGKAMRVYSNSADATGRSLTQFHNDNTSATGTRVLEVVQDAANLAMLIDQNANALGFQISSSATTSDVMNLAAAASTTGNILNISGADGLTTGSIINAVSDSASTGSRTLAFVHNDNVLATSAVPLTVRNDSTGILFGAQDSSGSNVMTIQNDGTLALPGPSAPTGNTVNSNSALKGSGNIFVTGATTASIGSDYNITSVTASSWAVAVTIDTNFASANYSVSATCNASGFDDKFAHINLKVAGSFNIQCYDISVGGAAASAYNVDVLMTGII